MGQHLYTGPHGTTLKAPLKMFEQAATLAPEHKHQLGPNLRYPVAVVKTEGNYAIVTFGKNDNGEQIAFQGRNTWAFWAAVDVGPPHAIIKSSDGGHTPILGKPVPRHGQLFRPGEFVITPFAAEVKRYFEGRELKQYWCSADVRTICDGATRWFDGGLIPIGQVATPEQCDLLFERDGKEFADALNNLVKVPLTEDEMTALFSFIYNCGAGALEESTLLKRINANASDAEIQYQFRRWTNGGLPGLIKRRNYEASLWVEDRGASREDFKNHNA
jgi:lysozyme